MIRLNLTPGPRWYDLGHGVRVEALPMTATILAEAVADTVAGGAEPGAPGFRAALSKAIGRCAIVAWEGVGDADGAPLEPSPERIDALLDIWTIEARWRAAYADPLAEMVAEGNASTPSPNGTSAEGETTAAGAAPAATTARH